MEISWIAIMAAGLSSMVLGAIWYAPPVFGKAWQAAAGLSDETVQSDVPGAKAGSHLCFRSGPFRRSMLGRGQFRDQLSV